MQRPNRYHSKADLPVARLADVLGIDIANVELDSLRRWYRKQAEEDMARVIVFFQDQANSRPHPTTVECGWQIVRGGEQTLLQLSTYGSDSRASDKKVSQTIQFDEGAAKELLRIVWATFPNLRDDR